MTGKVSETVRPERGRARPCGGCAPQGKCPGWPKTDRKCPKYPYGRGNFVHCYGTDRKSVRKVAVVNVQKRVRRVVVRCGASVRKCPKRSGRLGPHLSCGDGAGRECARSVRRGRIRPMSAC